MAEITKTEISIVEDIVGKVENGTGRRRYSVFVRGTTASVTDTLNLATYLPYITAIEGPRFEAFNEAVVNTSGTQSAWSTATITFAGHTGSGRYVGEWVVYV